MPLSRLRACNARHGCRSNHKEVVQVARPVDAQCLASVPASRGTLVPSDVTWFFASPVIALQSAWLASWWLSRLMMLGWAPMWPAAEAEKPGGDFVLKPSRQVIATPGSDVIRVMPAANADSVAPTTNAHDGSAEIVAFPRRRGTRRP